MDILIAIILLLLFSCFLFIVFSFIGWLLVRFTPFKMVGLRFIAAYCFSGKQVSHACQKYGVFRCSSCGRDDCRNWTCANYKNPLE